MKSCLEVEQLDSDTECSSDSSQGDSSSSEELEPNANKKALVPDPCQADEATFAKHRKVTHAMVATVDDNESRPFHRNQYWKAACAPGCYIRKRSFLKSCNHQWHFANMQVARKFGKLSKLVDSQQAAWNKSKKRLRSFLFSLLITAF